MKFLLAKNILTGTPFDKGKSPYQDFDLLLKVRNALVHFRSENLYLATDTFSGMIQPEVKPDSIDRLFSKLRSKNILKPEEDCHQGGLIERISTPEAAKWACNIVPDMISETLLGCPDDFNLFRLGLEGLIAKIP